MSRWLASAVVLVGASAIAVHPAQAQAGAPPTSFAISFDDDETNYRTYTHSPDPDSLYEYGESAAVRALTDNDPSTNVELWYDAERPQITSSEIVDRNVGFTATSGNRQVRVSSVTAAEWDVYGEQWVNEFVQKYTPFEDAMSKLSTSAQVAFQASFRHAGLGDPNVTEFSLDAQGNITLQTAGFYDLGPIIAARVTQAKLQADEVVALALAPEPVKAAAAAEAGITVEQLEQQITTAQTTMEGLNAVLLALVELAALEQTLQASEVAKVEIYEEGELTATEYAYSFELVKSGIAALDDGESYSGLAEWIRPGDGSGIPGSQAAPEPGFLLGAAIAGGLFRAAKRRHQSKSVSANQRPL